MAESEFFRRFIHCFQSTATSNVSAVYKADAAMELRVNIICYGLGSFSKSLSAMHQLALLCATMRHLEAGESSFSLNRSELFEPILTENEQKVLKALGIDVLSTDSKGHYLMDGAPNVITFCLMPHCPRMLYNNLLATNWPHRRSFYKLFIFGNSFNEYDGLSIGSDPKDPLHRQSRWIRMVNELDIVRETDIEQWIHCKEDMDSLQRERAAIASNAFAFQKLMHFTTTSTLTRSLGTQAVRKERK